MTKSWGAPEGEMARLILIRHGEVDDNWRRLLYGSMDVPLSPKGETQTRRTAHTLASVEIHRVVASDLKRATALAELVAESRGIEVEIIPEIRERRFGRWEGREIADIMQNDAEAYGRFIADRAYARIDEDSENSIDTAERVRPAINTLISEGLGATTLVVAHSGSLRVAIVDALGAPLDSVFRFTLDNCGITTIDYYTSGTAHVRALNRIDHLEDC